MNKKFLTVILRVFFWVLIFAASPTKKTGAQIVFEPPSKFNDLAEMIDAVVNALFFFALPLSVLLLIVAAFIFLTAEGEPQKIAKAKTLIFYTLIALLIIILARAIASLVSFAVG